MDDNHLLGSYTKKMGQLLYGWSAAVHICQRFDQQYLVVFDQTASINRVEFFFAERDPKVTGDLIGNHESDIVPGIPIAAPRVAEADDQLQRILGRIFDVGRPIARTGSKVRFAIDALCRLPTVLSHPPEY